MREFWADEEIQKYQAKKYYHQNFICNLNKDDLFSETFCTVDMNCIAVNYKTVSFKHFPTVCENKYYVGYK